MSSTENPLNSSILSGHGISVDNKGIKSMYILPVFSNWDIIFKKLSQSIKFDI